MAQAIPVISAVVEMAGQANSAKNDAQAKSKANMNNGAGSFDFKPTVVEPKWGNAHDRLNDMVVGAGITSLPGAMASPAMQDAAIGQTADAGARVGFPATAPQPTTSGFAAATIPGSTTQYGFGMSPSGGFMDTPSVASSAPGYTPYAEGWALGQQPATGGQQPTMNGQQPTMVTGDPRQKSDLLDNSQKAVGMATSIAGLLQNSRPQPMPLQRGSAPQFRPTTQPAQQYDPRLMDYIRRMQGGY